MALVFYFCCSYFLKCCSKSRQRLYINRRDMNYTDLDKEKDYYFFMHRVVKAM